MAVKHTGKCHITRVDADPDLFARFAHPSLADRFLPLQVPGRHAVIPVHVTGLEAAGEQDLIAAKKEEVDGDGKFSCMDTAPTC